ncbi:hypothetical protein AJ79_04697 [Helicocarpus griseus UAMH5409]|uniref:SET domain-containing protein n=1 Tax=Helicocarpus griseus UAMH5409 TaxID=1447875 RepID=A0A2B7XS64_9EURO|nr:hypothetical protein AJ79_04697 [Helicocarpus griseus UAMH5409]
MASTASIQEQVLLTMELIYLDIHVASLQGQKEPVADPAAGSPSNSTTPAPTTKATTNIFALTASRTLTSAHNALKAKKTQPALPLQRLLNLAKSHGWMLLSICCHSIHFVEAANSGTTTTDNDNFVHWHHLTTLIHQNALSLELFAKLRNLDWLSPIPADLRPRSGGKLSLRPQHHATRIYPYVISQQGNSVYHPRYKGQKQLDIPSSFYNPSTYHPPPHYQRQLDNDGACAVCNNSSQPCTCTLSHLLLNTQLPPLLELREYPPRGVGVRSLASIKAGTIIGQYIGEMRRLPAVPDSTYALHHVIGDRSVCIIDARVYGNWTRYMNHSCRPNVVFWSAAVGMQTCVLVKAVRDVGVFEEITVDYGNGYFGREGRVCRCGEGCRFGEGGGDDAGDGGERQGGGEAGKGKGRERRRWRAKGRGLAGDGEEGAEGEGEGGGGGRVFLPFYKSLCAVQRFF